MPPLKPEGSKAPDIGRWGEAWALWHYQFDRNAALLATNWRGTQGEIDLILREGNELVFVEVKTRAATDQNPLSAAVESTRVERLQRVAREYFNELPPLRPAVRFDVIVVHFNSQFSEPPTFEVFTNTIQPVNFR